MAALKKIYVEMINKGEHEAAARMMADHMDNEAIGTYLRAINFYPNQQWWEWVNTRRSELSALKKLNNLFR